MKPKRSFVFYCLAASLTLAACGNATPSLTTPSSIPPFPTGTNTLPSPLPTGQATGTLQPVTATPIACSPEVNGYCLEEAYFVFHLPIALPGIDTVDRSYPYGGTEQGTRAPHHGVEFYNPSGTPVLAAAGGSVYFAGDDKSQKFSPWTNFYGNVIVVKHEIPGTPFATLYTLYAHLSKEEVSTGQTVSAGQEIGEVGASGSAQGSHLHFEVRLDPEDYSSTLNPELWLIPHSGKGSLAIKVVNSSGKTVFPTFNVQYFPDRDKPATTAVEVDSYATETVNSLDPWNEIAALGDQPAGWYRITFLWEGIWEEKFVEIQPGKLTLVEFTVN